MDSKAALQIQFDLVIREAWIDYQSSTDFKRAWDQASYAWGPHMEAMKEHVSASYEKDTGKKPSDDFVAETLQHIAERLLAETPIREAFVKDLASQIGLLVGWLLFPVLHSNFDLGEKGGNSNKVEKLNRLADMIGAIPEYSEEEAKSNLEMIAGVVRDYGYTWIWNYSPDQLDVLLTQSGLQHGYLRPILFIVGITWCTFGGDGSLACRGGLQSLKRYFAESLDIPVGYLTNIVREVCAELGGVEFRSSLLGPEEAIVAFEQLLGGSADSA